MLLKDLRVIKMFSSQYDCCLKMNHPDLFLCIFDLAKQWEKKNFGLERDSNLDTWIQSLAKFYNQHVFCQLYWRDKNKEKKPRISHFCFKKLLESVIHNLLLQVHRQRLVTGIARVKGLDVSVSTVSRSGSKSLQSVTEELLEEVRKPPEERGHEKDVLDVVDELHLLNQLVKSCDLVELLFEYLKRYYVKLKL